MVIVKEQPLKDLPIPPDDHDAPPSYHHVEASSSSSIRSRDSGRRPPPLHPHRSTASFSSSIAPPPCKSSISASSFASLIETKLESKKAKLKSNLIDFLSGGTAQNVKDVKNMAYMSVRDVVKNPGAQQSIALVETCAEMCRAKGVDFSAVLQDPYLEGHRALYWIIIGRPPTNNYEMLSTILKHCGPLYPEAIEEVRLASVQVGDQMLFSHLWRHPAYGALCGTDRLLLGTDAPTDYVDVQETTTNEVGTFVARFAITHFHKRMSISGRVALEFIARGRLWCLKFHATSDKQINALGPWSISLSIINPSPPTWLDSRIVITEPRRKPSAFLPPWPLSKESAVASLLPVSAPDARRDKPPIQFRLQTTTQQLQPSTSTKTKVGRTELVAHFAENAASSGLQYPDSVYYSPDGNLQVIMEARLEQPYAGQGCVVC